MLTYLTAQGLSDAQIQLISGHESKKSLKVYQHLSLEFSPGRPTSKQFDWSASEPLLGRPVGLSRSHRRCNGASLQSIDLKLTRCPLLCTW